MGGKKAKAEPTSGEKVSGYIKSTDLFGSSIGFLIKGDSTLNTWMGTFLSLAIFAVVALYATKQFEVLTAKTNTTFLLTNEPNAIDMQTKHTFEDLNFNIAFGLQPNDFSLIETDALEDYITFMAVMHNGELGPDGKFVNIQTPLKFHKCSTEEAGFYKASGNQEGFLGALMPKLFCLDNAQDITLWGNFKVTSVNTLIILPMKCMGRPTCKSDTEIDEFIEKNGNLMIVFNN